MGSYHGIYMSSITSTTGCNKQFASTSQENMQFPPRVSLACDRCDKTHSFSLRSTHSVSTPTQRRRFRIYCEAMGYEQDVELELK